MKFLPCVYPQSPPLSHFIILDWQNPILVKFRALWLCSSAQLNMTGKGTQLWMNMPHCQTGSWCSSETKYVSLIHPLSHTSRGPFQTSWVLILHPVPPPDHQLLTLLPIEQDNSNDGKTTRTSLKAWIIAPNYLLASVPMYPFLPASCYAVILHNLCSCLGALYTKPHDLLLGWGHSSSSSFLSLESPIFLFYQIVSNPFIRMLASLQ